MPKSIFTATKGRYGYLNANCILQEKAQKPKHLLELKIVFGEEKLLDSSVFAINLDGHFASSPRIKMTDRELLNIFRVVKSFDKQS